MLAPGVGYHPNALTLELSVWPVATTTPAGLPGWGPRSAPGSDEELVSTRGLRSRLIVNHTPASATNLTDRRVLTFP